jgi:hypothetical protein
VADKVSRGLWFLDYRDLCAEAMRRTGLEDFGDPPLAPSLPLLVDSLEREAGLRPLGRFLIRIHLRDLLETRLKLTAAWKAKRHLVERQSISRPVFIVGMPRSGSTFLHELLAANHENRSPRVWEVMFPLAAGGGNPAEKTRHIRKTEACLWWFRRLAPRADSVYPMRAQTPHECVAIQSYAFLSEEFVSTCQIPGYEAYLRACDLAPAYEWQKRFLQYLQVNETPKRWVLKSPDHVHGLEALFKVFPDACLIQTHRNPIEVLKSSADLARVLYGLYGRACEPAEMLARETRMLAANTERFIQFRDAHPELEDRIVDVKYTEITADPLKVVLDICNGLGAPLSEERASEVRQLAASRSRYQGRRASSEPFRFRFDAGAELHRFERYCLRFGLPFEAQGN